MADRGGPGEPTESGFGQRPDNGSLFFGGSTELLPFPMPFTPESYQAVLGFARNHNQEIDDLQDSTDYVLSAGQTLQDAVTDYQTRRAELDKQPKPFTLGKVAVCPPDSKLEKLAGDVRILHHSYAYHRGILPWFQSKAGTFATLLANELTQSALPEKIRIGGSDYIIGHHRDVNGDEEIAGIVRIGTHKNDPNRDVIFGYGSLNQRVLEARYVGANAAAGQLANNTRHARIATPEDWQSLLCGIRQAVTFDEYFSNQSI